jgi:hypothetical protein
MLPVAILLACFFQTGPRWPAATLGSPGTEPELNRSCWPQPFLPPSTPLGSQSIKESSANPAAPTKEPFPLPRPSSHSSPTASIPAARASSGLFRRAQLATSSLWAECGVASKQGNPSSSSLVEPVIRIRGRVLSAPFRPKAPDSRRATQWPSRRSDPPARKQSPNTPARNWSSSP